MVYLKKILVFVLAVITAAVLMEIFVVYVIHYPKYGLDKKVFFSNNSQRIPKIFIPYSEYWTVEGGNKVYMRNNIGLPGIDVNVNYDSKNVFVLGSSFVESPYIPPEDMATSQFQMLLKKDFSNYTVLNLGYSGYTVYDDFMRAAYFDKYYSPEKVIVVIDKIYESFPITNDIFKLSPDFGKPDNSFLTLFVRAYANNSSFLYLLSTSAGKRSRAFEEEREKVCDTTEQAIEETRRNSLIRLEMCLQKFKEKYGNKFILISIIDDEENEELRSLSNKVGVNYISKNILSKPGYRINGFGHINSEGSKILSNLLYEAFIKFSEK